MRVQTATALVLLCAAGSLPAQRAVFTPTLYWDSGLIDTPAAWVAPLGGDVAIHAARVQSDSVPWRGLSGSSSQNYNVSVSASLWGRAEVGASVFTSNLHGGFFAKALIWDQPDGAFRKGLVHWMPSVAVGIRNVGNQKQLTRWAEAGVAGFSTSPTLYAVATRTVALGAVDEPGARAKAQLSLNLGAGNGLFSNDGGIGSNYAKHSTSGAFAGVKMDVATSRFSNLSLLAELNGWDYNVGAVFDVRGIRAGLYLLEVDAGSAAPPSWSYRKVAFSLGWQTNARALVRGSKMEERVAQMERERERLTRDIRSSEARVAALENQLRTLEGASDADRRSQRVLLEQKLREEQEALKRLEERLKLKKPED